jgi:hypothetical protein
MKKIVFLLTVLFACCALQAAAQPTDPKVQIRFDRYHTYEEIAEILKQLHGAYPDLTKLASVGKSFEGREIWLLTINNAKTGPDLRKPAFYMDGNIHGNEIQGGEVCLYTIWYILGNYGKMERVTNLVDRVALYFIPVVNVDGRAYWMAEPNTPGSSRSGRRPVDDDRDGLFDEDGPDDLDGDGSITQMRIQDPAGRFRPDPEDPRLMIPAKPDEAGGWVLLGEEGIDNDGDGAINEDGTGYYDLNRNWGFNWMPQYVQTGAGEYPLSEPEARAISRFLTEHPNIAAAQVLHNAAGMILRGPGAKNMGQFLPEDVRVYDFLGKRGEQIIPGYRYLIAYKDLYTTFGDFDSYLHSTFGAFAFTTELYPSTWEDITGDGKVDEKEQLKFDDYLRHGEGFKEWKPYKHPTYGDIEIGGWSKFTRRPTPEFMLPEECYRNSAFAIFHAENIPELKFGGIEVESLGGGLYKVTAVVINDRVIPTRSAQSVRNNIGRPDFAVIEGSGLQVVTGGRIADKYRGIIERQEKDPARLRVDRLEGKSAERLQWLVKGIGSAKITYDSEKGGRIEREFSLK